MASRYLSVSANRISFSLPSLVPTGPRVTMRRWVRNNEFGSDTDLPSKCPVFCDGLLLTCTAMSGKDAIRSEIEMDAHEDTDQAKTQTVNTPQP